MWVEAEVDLADALDLDTALSAGAARLADLGSAASLDVRRSEALGQMARHQLALDLDTSTDTSAETSTRPLRPGEVVLHVHLSEHAIAAPRDRAAPGPGGEHPLASSTPTRSAPGAARPGVQVTVKPVVDLAEHLHVDQYQVPDRLAAQAAERDLTCVFPWCTRPAEACDTDHVIPYAEGGPTASDNLAPLCRRHHRLKTHHSGWGYTVLEPGSYLWSSPHGYQFLRDHTGTTDVTRDRASHPPDE